MVSAVGLGCGGHSRLGMAHGATTDAAADLVRRAIDLGIDFIDTARIYGTEEAVGRGIAGHDRVKLFLSTKSWVGKGPPGARGDHLTAKEFAANLDASLRALGTDYVDLFHLHGVDPAQLDHAMDVLLPEIHRQRDAGKVRFVGITEVFRTDTRHEMLARALPTGAFDVAMVGFNMLNQSARRSVFPLTIEHDVGTLIMFAVRRALNSAANAAQVVAELIDRGEIDPEQVNPADPFDFLVAAPGVRSQVEAAYRFCRHEPGAHVVLTGTGNPAHLEENVASILAPPLPQQVLDRLDAVFGTIVSASGE
ncbi:aldo/keto reductase [Tsuneonella sp. HG222]